MSRQAVRDLIELYHAHDVVVSTEDFIEYALIQTVAQVVQHQIPGVIEVLVHVGSAGTRRHG
jgi:hypothetical protein